VPCPCICLDSWGFRQYECTLTHEALEGVPPQRQQLQFGRRRHDVGRPRGVRHQGHLPEESAAAQRGDNPLAALRKQIFMPLGLLLAVSAHVDGTVMAATQLQSTCRKPDATHMQPAPGRSSGMSRCRTQSGRTWHRCPGARPPAGCTPPLQRPRAPGSPACIGKVHLVHWPRRGQPNHGM
jgi:hypothetical protein